MRNPTTKGPSKPEGKNAPVSGLQVVDAVARVANTVGVVVDYMKEREKTKQVIATTGMQSGNAVQKTEQVKIEASVRFKEIEKDDAQNQRLHALAMAELQLRAQQLDDERQQHRVRVEKVIEQAEDRLAAPQRRLE